MSSCCLIVPYKVRYANWCSRAHLVLDVARVELLHRIWVILLGTVIELLLSSLNTTEVGLRRLQNFGSDEPCLIELGYTLRLIDPMLGHQRDSSFRLLA